MNRKIVTFAAGLGIATMAVAATPREVVGSLTSSGGLYSNQIPDLTLTQAYSEVCFVNGARLVDQHAAGGSTAGGDCVAGDTGFLIEMVERAATTWDLAIETCILNKMRLAEATEYMIACRNRVDLGIGDLGEDFEWSGNTLQTDGTLALLGSNNCTSQSTAFALLDSVPFRCAR